MSHPLAHFLSDLFPEIEHPQYQSAFEKISFVLVTATIIGALAAGLTAVLVVLF